ncbi:TPA_asm: hypothetical protein PROPHIFSIL01-1_34 [Mycobacterium phage prophiFSIL01-1]|nr:TPA_asm: hypothetical protein PROPHIFSIL01-1_34 [Mycobacterium phage prophiFSIL01-1]
MFVLRMWWHSFRGHRVLGETAGRGGRAAFKCSCGRVWDL